MLARVTGQLDSLESNRALIGTPDGTLAYEVLVPAYLAASLAARPDPDAPVTLHTIQYLESLNQGASFIPRIIGFASTREREFFELITSVKGLGNKRALRAMAAPPGAIARAIADRDHRYLQSLPEIGPKLAELIIHDLKSKVDGFMSLGLTSTDMNLSPDLGRPALRAGRNAPAESTIEPKPTTAVTNGTPPKRTKKPAPAAPSPAHPPHPLTSSPAQPAPRPPIRETIDALIALGESPLDAERLVAKALDTARANDQPIPTHPGQLLTLAYAAR